MRLIVLAIFAAAAGTVACADELYVADGRWHSVSLALGGSRYVAVPDDDPEASFQQLYVISDTHFARIRCHAQLEASYSTDYRSGLPNERYNPRQISYHFAIRWDNARPENWNNQIDFKILEHGAEWSGFAQTVGGAHGLEIPAFFMEELLNNDTATLGATLYGADWSYEFPLSGLLDGFMEIGC